jgi:uncharacterized membrane protein YfcA
MSAFLAGLAMGLVFSLLGAGGGLIAVPVLMVLFKAPLMEATAGALTVVWAAAASGTVGHAREARVTWRAAWLVGLPSMVGAVAGAKLHRLVPDRVTMVLFALVLLVATALMFRAKKDARRSAAARLDVPRAGGPGARRDDGLPRRGRRLPPRAGAGDAGAAAAQVRHRHVAGHHHRCVLERCTHLRA